jgi:hypothetical protein
VNEPPKRARGAIEVGICGASVRIAGRRSHASRDYRALRIFVTRQTGWRSHPSPFVIPSRNAALVIPSRRRGIFAARNAGIPRDRSG